MPRRQFIDKKSATTYALVHRAQNDPLIHSSDAPQMVFAEVGSSSRQPPGQSKKVKERGDLEEEFGMTFRKNEGQAAEYGVYYDDTEYDYMQHMRDLGSGEGGSVAWVPATSTQKEKKGKGKQRLEDALAGMGLDDEDTASEGGVSLSSRETSASQRSLMPEDMLPSEFVKKQTYQDQQDIPDAIAGFQPNMDPRLREVLEALEDEAYVDDEDDIFEELQGDGYEVNEDEFDNQFWEGEQQSDGMQRFLDSQGEADDDGWESDDTIKAENEFAKPVLPVDGVALPPADPNATPAADPTNGAWMSEFSKFKTGVKEAKGVPSEMTGDRSMLSSLATGRKKKRKGAKTSTTNYSMTSSALARTDPQTLLDARFDKLMEKYDADEYEGLDTISEADDMSLASGVSGMSRASRASRVSKADSIASGISRTSGISTYSRMTDSEAPQLVRSDFDNIMDSFLGNQISKGGKHRRDIGIAPGRKGKRGVHGEGLKELDEIRQGLGKARIQGKV
ncbi:Low temperature viability protein, partial [Myriangium duriaei CBS 260.36]